MHLQLLKSRAVMSEEDSQLTQETESRQTARCLCFVILDQLGIGNISNLVRLACVKKRAVTQTYKLHLLPTQFKIGMVGLLAL